MKTSTLITLCVFLLPAVLCLPVSVFSGDNNFNIDGMAIDKVQYEILASQREKSVSMTLENGYTDDAGIWKDPIKLRKKRIEQWEQIKRAATAAILANGGTLSHHHSIGYEHQPLAAEYGDAAVAALTGAKAALDPTGLMNPGKLLAD